MRRQKRLRRISYAFEEEAWDAGHRTVAGVDEAGCGCLAGPVVAGAVILDPARPIPGLDDSKRLSAPDRERLFDEIRQRAMAWSSAAVGNDLVDGLNILRASHEAMRRAVLALDPRPDFLLVDGRPLPAAPVAHRAVVGGDGRSFSIAAASIVAKVTRDRLMAAYDREWPDYGFAAHKGYGTERHLQAIRDLGPCPIHRRTFRGVLSAPGQQCLPLTRGRN